jgi:uncharacterized membrane protein (DUF485 family)
LLDSSEFRQLIARRWLISALLTVALFVTYYGYILLVALDKPFMARRLGSGVTTLGILLGVAVILISWVLTAIYVAWANTRYDAEVRRLRREIR